MGRATVVPTGAGDNGALWLIGDCDTPTAWSTALTQPDLASRASIMAHRVMATHNICWLPDSRSQSRVSAAAAGAQVAPASATRDTRDKGLLIFVIVMSLPLNCVGQYCRSFGRCKVDTHLEGIVTVPMISTGSHHRDPGEKIRGGSAPPVKTSSIILASG